MSDPFVDLWKEQPVVSAVINADVLKNLSKSLRRRLLVRDAIEQTAGLLAMLIFIDIAWLSGDPIVCIAVAIQACGILAVMHNLWRRQRVPPALYAETSLAFHLALLTRHRDAVGSVWRWYLAPLLPGVIAFSLALAHVTAREAGRFWLLPIMAIIMLVPGALIFVGVDWMNRRAARCLDREIALLEGDALTTNEAA